MSDRWANIDLVFRNGLKDFEALPPEGVWEEIKPVVTKKRSFFLLKAAAALLALISVGSAAFFIGRSTAFTDENILAENNTPITFNIDRSIPVRSNTIISSFKDYTVEGKSSISYPAPSTAFSGSQFSINNEENKIFIADNPIVEDEGGPALPREAVTELPDNLDKIVIVNNSLKLDVQGFEPEKLKPTERWSISALASPTYYSKIGSGNDDAVKEMIASEQGQSSYSGGFSVSYKLSRKVSIQTGFYYASHGQKVEDVYSYSGFQEISSSKGGSNFILMTSDGPIHSKNADVFMSGSSTRIRTSYTRNVFDPEKASLVPIGNSLIQRFGYIQMPLTVRYKFLERNLSLDLSGGISYDFLVGNSAFIKQDGQKYEIGRTEGLNSFIFSSSVGMGMQYSLSEKMSLNLEPTFRYFLNPFNDGAGTWIHPYSFGVFSGFSYKF